MSTRNDYSLVDALRAYLHSLLPAVEMVGDGGSRGVFSHLRRHIVCRVVPHRALLHLLRNLLVPESALFILGAVFPGRFAAPCRARHRLAW